jgi:hypothetical protein
MSGKQVVSPVRPDSPACRDLLFHRLVNVDSAQHTPTDAANRAQYPRCPALREDMQASFLADSAIL